MAKGEAVCVCKHCGKTFTKSINGLRGRDVESWELYAKSHYDECSECYSNRMRENRSQRLLEQAEKEKSLDAVLPPLEGTEKQITWAMSIRHKIINKVVVPELTAKNFEAFYKNRGRVSEEDYTPLSWFISNIATLTSAKFYIDNRDSLGVFSKKIL